MMLSGLLGPKVMMITAMALSSAVAIAQAIPDVTSVGSAERLGLEGLLIVAVGVLWRTLDRKDKEVQLQAQAVSAALITSAEALKAVVERIDRLTDAISQLNAVHATMSRGASAGSYGSGD